MTWRDFDCGMGDETWYASLRSIGEKSGMLLVDKLEDGDRGEFGLPLLLSNVEGDMLFSLAS